MSKEINPFFLKKQHNEKVNSSFDSEISNSSIEISEFELEDQQEKNYNKIINIYSYILNKCIEITPLNYKDDSIFHNSKIPKIVITEYLNRIIEYSNVEENTLICSLIYIEEIRKKIKLTNFNIHKILFTAIITAIKFNEDKIFNNNFYSLIGGISKEKLLELEYHFLILMDFKLYINENKFKTYKQVLEDVNLNFNIL